MSQAGSTSSGGSSTPTETLIASKTATNQAAVVFTTELLGTYRYFKVIGTGIQLVNGGGQALWMRCSTDGGATYDSGNNYSYSEQYFASDSGNDWNRSSADGKILLIIPYGDSSTSTNSNSLDLDLFNVNNAALHFTCLGKATSNQLAVNADIRHSGSYNVTGAVNGIQFLGANGNIFTGTFALYGIT